MALSLSPLAPDPGYEHTTAFCPKGKATDPAPQGRVRPEARAIAKRQTQGTIAQLLSSGGDFPPRPTTSTKKPPQPKNHNRANQRRIRELAERGKRKKEEVDRPATPPVTSTRRYSHISSRINTNLEQRPKTAQPSSLQTQPVRQEPRPTTASTATSSKNFLAANIKSASKRNVKQDQQQQRLTELQKRREDEFSHHQKGKMPQYLVSRRLQWKKAEEERRANIPDPSVPPGHTLMPNKERRHTTDVLTQHQSRLTQELQSLPLRCDTLKHRIRRAELESKLTEIDDALKIFSRPKVFVKIDD